MPKISTVLAKQIDADEQALRDILRGNIKKHRRRRNWSQFALAAKIDMSTNFLADMEAGNTWISSLTLVKLAKAFEIEAFELFRPENESENTDLEQETGGAQTMLSRFCQDLAVVLQESVEKAVEHVKKQYKIG